MKTIKHKDATIAFREIGQGEPIILAHCSSASHKEWMFMVDALKDGYRLLMPDLIGYGDTTGHMWPDGTLVDCTDADVIEAMIDYAAEPVHLVGHSYGGASCIDAAFRDSSRVKSLFVIEPVSFPYLREAEDGKPWRQIAKVANRIIAAAKMGNMERSADHYMGFWLGWLKWRLAPKRFRQSVVASMPKVAHEFEAMFHMIPMMDALDAFPVATTFVSGGKSPRPALAVTKMMAERMPNSFEVALPKAGHMSPITHPKDIKRLLLRHFMS